MTYKASHSTWNMKHDIQCQTLRLHIHIKLCTYADRYWTGAWQTVSARHWNVTHKASNSIWNMGYEIYDIRSDAIRYIKDPLFKKIVI